MPLDEIEITNRSAHELKNIILSKKIVISSKALFSYLLRKQTYKLQPKQINKWFRISRGQGTYSEWSTTS